MPSENFAEKTAALRNLGPQRVWSLMISLFGDLAQGSGDVIEGPVLSAIMAALDVKPEAARVALHRLRNDGWITSTKVGRISHHMLSSKGRDESIGASPRIYADPPDAGEGWQVVIVPGNGTEDAEQMAVAGFTPVLPRVFAGPSGIIPPADSLVLTGGNVPSWLRDEIQPSDVQPDYIALQASLSDLDRALPKGTALSALETAVLRCLIVHNWRRLVLKHPLLPGALGDTRSPSHQCHIMVSELLARFPRPDLRKITLTDRTA